MSPPPVPDCPALFLDADGTILEIAERPDGVRPSDRILALLGELPELLDGALALVSGRPIAELDQIFPHVRLPAAGVHGAELRRSAGQLERTVDAANLLETACDRAQLFVSGRPGLLLENKGSSLALHYRRGPDREQAVRAFMRRLAADIGDQVELLEGHKVIELKVAGVSKGTAITALLQEEPFKSRTPVFLGDDRTDEQGFEIVNACGGVSIKVGEGHSKARFRLADVDAVTAWLEKLTVRLKAQGQHD